MRLFCSRIFVAHFVVCCNCAGRRNDFSSIRRSDIVKKLLSRFGKHCSVLGYKNKGALNKIAAVLDRFLGGNNAVHGKSLYAVFKSGEGGVAYGVGILRNSGDNIAGGGKLLAVLAGILCIRNGFKAVAGAASCFAPDKYDFAVISANIFPVSDFTFVDGSNLFHRKVGDGVFGVYDYCDAVKGKNGFFKTLRLLVVFKSAAGKADVAATLGNCGDSGAGTGGVVGEVYALVVLHKGFAKGADNLFHRGGAVGGNGASGAAASGEHKRHAAKSK